MSVNSFPLPGGPGGGGRERVIFRAVPHVARRHPETTMMCPRAAGHGVALPNAFNVGADGLIGPMGNGSCNRMPLGRIAPERRTGNLFSEQSLMSRGNTQKP